MSSKKFHHTNAHSPPKNSYLIHQPFFAKSDADLQAKWADMEAVRAAGLAKSIGVSNYGAQHLAATLKTATVPPAVNQIEFHPYLQHAELLEFHKQHGIATQAYGPLSAATKASPGPVDDYSAAVAKKYAVSTGEVALRWCIDQDVVAITTSSKVSCASFFGWSVNDECVLMNGGRSNVFRITCAWRPSSSRRRRSRRSRSWGRRSTTAASGMTSLRRMTGRRYLAGWWTLILETRYQ